MNIVDWLLIPPAIVALLLMFCSPIVVQIDPRAAGAMFKGGVAISLLILVALFAASQLPL